MDRDERIQELTMFILDKTSGIADPEELAEAVNKYIQRYANIYDMANRSAGD